VEKTDVASVAGALYPGMERFAHEIGATTSRGADGVLRLHVTRYAPEHELHEGVLGCEQQHLVVGLDPKVTVTPHGGGPSVTPRWIPEASMADSASVVIHHGLATIEPPPRVLDGLMRDWPGLLVAGVITSTHSCLVGWWRHVGEWMSGSLDPEHRGACVTLTAEDTDDGPVPVGMYPSLLYGWMRWWWAHHGSRPDGRPFVGDLPAPPTQLELVDTTAGPHRLGRVHRVVLSDYHETAWPPRPYQPQPFSCTEGIDDLLL
jgi:hypothetical protein